MIKTAGCVSNDVGEVVMIVRTAGCTSSKRSRGPTRKSRRKETPRGISTRKDKLRV